MRKILLIIGVIAFMSSCAPGKSSDNIRFDVYCDSCSIKITNGYKDGANWHFQEEYNSIITANRSISISRYEAPDQCIRVASFINYATNQATYVGIENGDTIVKSINTEDGFCH